MRVLVAGAGGLIGRALTAQLAADDHEVVVLLRPSGSAAKGPRAVGWDPAAGSIDRAALEAAGPFHAVVNLAGAGVGDRRWTADRKAEILSSRVRPTRLLSATIARLDPRPDVLVNASAVGYYGDRGDEELTEVSDAGSGFLSEVCRQWEAAAEPASAGGIRVVFLRSGVVLSASGGALGRQLPLFRVGLGFRLGTGHQYMSWISLADELSVIGRSLTDARLSGPVNATAPEPVRNAELVAALAASLHRPAFLVVPRVALAVALGPELADELLASQRALPVRLQAVGHRFAHPDLGSALAVL